MNAPFKTPLILSLALLAQTASAAFTVSSEALNDGAPLKDAQAFNGFGCKGQNISPDLKWSGAPEGTKSFAITAYDPDAPTGSGWWHWTLINLPSQLTEIKAGAGTPGSKLLPKGAVQTRTDFGKPGYGGPCPPEGDKPHRYVFRIVALKTEKLPLDRNASGAMVGFYLNQNKLDEAVITGTYGRPAAK